MAEQKKGRYFGPLSEHGPSGGPYARLEAEMVLIRTVLGISPVHSALEAVRVLHDRGREAFEEERGPRCDWAHEWEPR